MTAKKKKPANKPARTLHLEAVTNLGHSLALLAQHHTNPTLLGNEFDRALKAAIKAAYPGRQKDKQIEPDMTAARKAAGRQFASTVKRLKITEGDGSGEALPFAVGTGAGNAAVRSGTGAGFAPLSYSTSGSTVDTTGNS